VYRDRLIILFLSVFTLWLWWPRVQQGLPYFYEEDEAHHFNRTVEMVKSGDLNPHYFHKPSLHFYLRIPAIALSFLNEVRNGRARKVEDIVTRDPAGIGGYAFSTSHPGVVKGARLVSVVCGLVVILSVYAILLMLTGKVWWSVYGSLLTLGAQLLYLYGAEVGVDIVTAACVLTCCVVTIWGRRGRANPYITGAVSSLLAGLAIGAKYNSAPVVLVPFYSMVQYRCNTWAGVIVKGLGFCLFVGLGFFCSTPYVVSSLPLFLNQVAYEVWHYGIAGHEGHMSEPGLAHFILYLKDLSFSYFGFGAVIFGLLGLLYLGWKREFLVVLFPVIYVWYMSDQRAHFIRNMVVIVPFLGIGAAYGLSALSSAVRTVAARILVCAIGGLMMMESYYHLFMSRSPGDTTPESRILAEQWLRSVEDNKGVRLALDSSLQFEPHLRLDRPGRTVNLEHTSLEQVFLNGFDGVLLAKAHRMEGALIAQEWSGVSETQRIVNNPWIGAVMFDAQWQIDHNTSLLALGQVLPMVGAREWTDFTGTEKWLWIQKRQARLPIVWPGTPVQLSVEVMTPWENQIMTINNQECQFGSVGEWQVCRIFADVPELQITIGKVGIVPGGGDTRVLGVALRGVTSF
jgi:hypothetical protein